MNKKLEGKVAVVTGASKGIGASIAEALGAEGASVVVNYSSSQEGAQKVVDKITKKGGKAIAIQANIAHPQEIERLFNDSAKAFGKIDILVNNAGVYETSSIEQITLDHYRKIFDLNVLGLLLATKEAIKHFGSSGSIINISSIASSTAPSGFSVYSASKAAVDTLTRSLSKELGPKKIRINSINPGMVETEGTISQGILESDFRKHAEAATPLGRIGQPSDIAPVVVFLASDEAFWITGETLIVAGGYR